MPRFFFDIVDGQTAADTVGVVLKDMNEARIEASLRVADRLQKRPHGLWSEGDWSVRVRDQDDLQLFTLVVYATLSPAGRESYQRSYLQQGHPQHNQK